MSDDKKRILIMEDSDVFAGMLIEFLSCGEYTLERAVNGLEGIKKTYSFMPHLIISDVEMPLFNGYQAVRFLKTRKNTAAIPVFMFTSLGDTKDKFWGSNTGADKYFVKSPDSLETLRDAIPGFLPDMGKINFAAIEKEAVKISTESIIEIMNNLLDNKLFQTTVISMLTKLSDKAFSMEMMMKGIFDLLHTICEAEIAVIMIRGSNNALYVYTANFAGFTEEITGDFSGICVSDFNKFFPDFQVTTKKNEDFCPVGNFNKKIVSYTTNPLTIAGENFASVHIGNSINEYFSPLILENITVFLNAATPVIANALSMQEMAELQKNTRAAFARYVPADVMDEIIDNSLKMTKQSESRNITVLFSDMRNFTAISEHSSAQDVVDFLNSYFAVMGNIIVGEGGHVDKFIGDAIMALFGAFQNQENTMIEAVSAAIKMIAAIENLDISKLSFPKGNLEMGIGINSGLCVMGNIGFQNKMDYTVIGDAVNIASRLEGASKIYHHPLIVSENVYSEIKDKLLCRKVDNVRVMGKEEHISIYAVYSGYDDEDEDEPHPERALDLPRVSSLLVNRETLENYNKGLKMFYMREWKPAQEYFLLASKADETDYLSQLYLRRAIDFTKNPPPNDWDGVVSLMEK